MKNRAKYLGKKKTVSGKLKYFRGEHRGVPGKR
jgi:hypothetical protein